MKHLFGVAVGTAAIAALMAGAANAASTTNNFNVKVTINVACTVSAADLNFGSFTGSIPANTLGSTTATVSCNKGTSYALSFVTGANPAAAVDTTTISGKIVAAVSNPAVGTYTIPQAIYVL